MNDFAPRNLFAPLGREYCVYFYWLTVIAFILFFLALVDTVMRVLKGRARLLNGFIALLAPFLLYFNNRLLYSMCNR
jgi:hypothetical protein